MRKFILIAVASMGLGMLALTTQAEDAKSWTGVLIDNHCGDKQADEAAASKHPASCAKKDSCAASGYQLMVGDKHVKFDEKGNEQAKKFLEKAESTKVTVEGSMDGD